MSTRTRSAQEARVPLSRDRVLTAAIELADAGGIEALTMRRLAQALGVEAMTLYYHVANKEDILGGLADTVMAQIELPSGGAAWKAAIRRTAVSAYETFERHPWAAGLVLSSSGTSPARLRYMDGILGCFRENGFSARLTDHAYHALESHIMGFTLWEVAMNLGSREELQAMAGAFLAELPRDELPHLAEHIEQHLQSRDPDDEGEFAFGLDLILDGLERAAGQGSKGVSLTTAPPRS